MCTPVFGIPQTCQLSVLGLILQDNNRFDCHVHVKLINPVSWTLNINASDANCPYAINAKCLEKTRTLRDGQAVKALHAARVRPDEQCISAFRQHLLVVPSSASSEYHGDTFLFPCFKEARKGF